MEESNTIQAQPTSDTSVPAPAPAPAPAPEVAQAPAPTPEELKKEQIRKYYMELQKQNYEKCIEVVMGQTTYSREEAIAGLQKHKGNVMLVVKEFLGVPEKTETESNFMDKAASTYIKTQERNKIVNQMLERQKKIREESANASANTIVSSAEPSTQSQTL
jgi:NACalpha-BTF3-like transcription factor